MLYLLQLVQALKYENFDKIETNYTRLRHEMEDHKENMERLARYEDRFIISHTHLKS